MTRQRNSNRRARTLINAAFKRIRLGDYRDCASLRTLIQLALEGQAELKTTLNQLVGDAVEVDVDFVLEGLQAGYFVLVISGNVVQLRTSEVELVD